MDFLLIREVELLEKSEGYGRTCIHSNARSLSLHDQGDVKTMFSLKNAVPAFNARTKPQGSSKPWLLLVGFPPL